MIALERGDERWPECGFQWRGARSTPELCVAPYSHCTMVQTPDGIVEWRAQISARRPYGIARLSAAHPDRAGRAVEPSWVPGAVSIGTAPEL